MHIFPSFRLFSTIFAFTVFSTVSADGIVRYTPINVAVSNDMFLTSSLHSLCALDRTTTTSTVLSVTACGLNCMMKWNCFGFNYVNVSGSCGLFESSQPTKFTTSPSSLTCSYFQKQPINFSANLIVKNNTVVFEVMFSTEKISKATYSVYFPMNVIPVSPALASTVVYNHEECATLCNQNRACNGYVYDNISCLCNQFNEKMPAYYSKQQGLIYHKKAPLGLPWTCNDHRFNGRRKDDFYSVFLSGNPSRMTYLECLNMTTTNPLDVVNNPIFNARDCSDIQQLGFNISGVYQLIASGKNITAYCNMTVSGGGWTVIQRRKDGSENFYRNWTDYARGFGSLSGEHWIGNDKLTALTLNGREMKLRFDVVDKDGVPGYAEYSNFVVYASSRKYSLTFTSYLGGNIGDSFSYHNNQIFTTYDKGRTECSMFCRGGWWYNSCQYCNPNGEYNNDNYGKGINWATWRGHYYSLPFMEMKIKPV